MGVYVPGGSCRTGLGDRTGHMGRDVIDVYDPGRGWRVTAGVCCRTGFRVGESTSSGTGRDMWDEV